MAMEFDGIELVHQIVLLHSTFTRILNPRNIRTNFGVEVNCRG